MNNVYSLQFQLEKQFLKPIDELISIVEKEHKTKIQTFTIEKNNCGKRKITTVNNDSYLWKIQKFLVVNIFGNFQFPEYVTGFQNKKSYCDFLNIHIGTNREYLKLDIKDFFNSIPVEQIIFTLVEKFEKNSLNKKNIYNLLLLCLTYKNEIPQGYQTSPVLSNYYFLRADLRIYKYCQKMGFRYSRYADDIIISSPISKEITFKNLKVLEDILEDFELYLNKNKIKFHKESLIMNGFVVDQEVRLSQKKLKELRRILFIIEKYKNPKIDEIVTIINSDTKTNSKNKKREFTSEYLMNFLSGYRAFIISTLKLTKQNSAWHQQGNKLIKRIEISLDKIV